jgi:hypothetical protein
MCPAATTDPASMHIRSHPDRLNARPLATRASRASIHTNDLTRPMLEPLLETCIQTTSEASIYRHVGRSTRSPEDPAAPSSGHASAPAAASSDGHRRPRTRTRLPTGAGVRHGSHPAPSAPSRILSENPAMIALRNIWWCAILCMQSVAYGVVRCAVWCGAESSAVQRLERQQLVE